MKEIVIAALLASTAGVASANEFAPVMQDYIESEVMSWASDPVLVEAIRARNAETASYSPDEIAALDQAWRAEVGTSGAPTITPILENPASDFLRARVADSAGIITEVFAMDAQGLNVATSSVTSDFWQGDEAKFTETFPAGAGAMHFGEVELDESSQTFQGQASMSIVDPETNEVIGAITVGLNADALF